MLPKMGCSRVEEKSDRLSLRSSFLVQFICVYIFVKKQRFNGQIRLVLKLVFVYLKAASKQTIHHKKYALILTVTVNSVLEATSLLILIFSTFSWNILLTVQISSNAYHKYKGWQLKEMLRVVPDCLRSQLSIFIIYLCYISTFRIFKIK